MLTDILDLIFPEEVSTAYIVNEETGEETEIDLNSWNPDDYSDEFLSTVGPDDMVYAVVTDQIPLDGACSSFEDGTTVGIFLIEPVHVDEVPEDFGLMIPITGDYTARGDQVYTLEDLTSFDPAIQHDDVRPESEDTGQDRMNAAVLLGEPCDEMLSLLDEKFVFMLGDLYGQKDRRNTQDGGWKRVELTLGHWLQGADKAPKRPEWGLTRHPAGKSKEGSSIVLAEAIDGARTDSAIKTMYAVGIDIDSGAKLADVVAKLEELDLFAIVYTSFSHGKSELVLKHDDVMRKLKLSDSPNRAQVQMYLREHHKDRYDESFIETIEIVEARKQTKDGLRIILKTEPLDKFRVILPLAHPVELSELGASVSQWKDIWADAVCGVAVNMLGVTFDATSCDVNRLFYLPRHKEGAEFYSAVVQGKPLRFSEIEPYSKTAYMKNRDPSDPFAAGTTDTGGGVDDRETYFTPGGIHLNNWHRKHKERFLISDVLESYCQDKLRVAGGERPGTCHIECPFESSHSSEGGTATMAMNPDSNSEHGYWTIFCKHDACQGRDKLEFLKEILDQKWFDESLLEDSEWNIPLSDEELEVTPEPEEKEEEQGPLARAAKFTQESTEDDIRKFIKKQLKLKIDKTMVNRVADVLAEHTALTKTDVNAIFKQERAALDRKARERAEEEGESTSSTPVVNQWDFGEMVKWGEQRIQDANAKKPRLFHYIDDIARIEETAERVPRIRMLSEKQFAAELNEITKWHHLAIMGDTERRREVSAPSDVVSQLYSSAHTVYPKLRGLVTTPTFVYGGEMITKPGYHSSGLYYWYDGELDVPHVNKIPTEEDLEKAKRLLVEEVFADFPLGALTRSEIVEQVFDPEGEGVPAVANLLAMLLLMFCRDLIIGPTPGHLLTKPSPGTGASLLTDVCSIIANGEVTAAQALPTSKEEMAKTLITVIADGANMIYFDNIDNSVDSGELASAMTAPKYKARMLGKSQSIEAEVRAVWVLCGNNVRLSPELIRRLVMIYLDANMANPEKRSNWRHDDIRSWALEHRGELVWACLTLIQNWVAKGMNPDSTVILNSYENWSRIMGGILRDAGIKGFLGNRDELKERASDGGEDDITLFLDAWWDRFMNKPVMMRSGDPKEEDLIKMAIQGDLQLPIKLKRSVDDEATYDPKQFGKFLRAYEGRVLPLSDGTEVKVVRGKRNKGGFMWHLEVVRTPDAD